MAAAPPPPPAVPPIERIALRALYGVWGPREIAAELPLARKTTDMEREGGRVFFNPQSCMRNVVCSDTHALEFRVCDADLDAMIAEHENETVPTWTLPGAIAPMVPVPIQKPPPKRVRVYPGAIADPPGPPPRDWPSAEQKRVDPVQLHHPLHVRVPWADFVDALRIRFIGVRRIALVGVDATVLPSRPAPGKYVMLPNGWEGKRSDGPPEAWVSVLQNNGTWREVRLPRPAILEEWIVYHDSIPIAEVVATRDDAVESNARAERVASFEAGGADAFVSGFPVHDSLICIGVGCAFTRGAPFVRTRERLVVRLLFTPDAPPTTATHVDGVIAATRQARLVFLELECITGPGTTAVHLSVHLDVTVTVCGARVYGRTVAIDMVPAFDFELVPLPVDRRPAAATAAGDGRVLARPVGAPRAPPPRLVSVTVIAPPPIA